MFSSTAAPAAPSALLPEVLCGEGGALVFEGPGCQGLRRKQRRFRRLAAPYVFFIARNDLDDEEISREPERQKSRAAL